jgi:hypothetical protein
MVKKSIFWWAKRNFPVVPMLGLLLFQILNIPTKVEHRASWVSSTGGRVVENIIPSILQTRNLNNASIF